MKSKIILSALSISLLLTACGSDPLANEMKMAMDNGQEIQISTQDVGEQPELEKFNWVELGQLQTFPKLRKTWDDVLNIFMFDENSKNGVLYVAEDGSWNGNNTLFNAFRNKYFILNYWDDNNITKELSNAAIDQFSDVDDLATAKIVTVNAYYNIIPYNADGTSGMQNYLTRAQSMASIYRADSPVMYIEENPDFTASVGDNTDNIYAQNITEDYLDYTNGSLNATTYNQYMTRAEVIYILMNRYYKTMLDGFDSLNVQLTDCKDAGNVAKDQGLIDGHAWQSYELEYCLQNPNDGVTSELYKSLALANSLGIINSTTRWNEPIRAGELLNFLITTYKALDDTDGFLVNAKSGNNEGINYFSLEEAEANNKHEEVSIGDTEVLEVKDVTDLGKLKEVYGDELDMTDAEFSEVELAAQGFTFDPVDEYKQVDYCYFLNVRVGPSTDFRIIKSVKAGTKAHIVGRCKENGWYRVIADGKIAYQCGVYFSELGSKVQNKK